MVIQPKGTQKNVLALEPQGHTVVLGTAGSGKTTMALLLAKKYSNLTGQPKVLIVTFNRALVAYMNDIQSAARGITVEHYHLFARGYLNSVGKMGRNIILDDEKKKESIIETIINEARQKYPKESTFLRPIQIFVEEIKFIQKFGVDTLERYKVVERFGRADTNVSRENRGFFFEIYENYIKKREEAGYMYDWDDIAIAVYNSLLKDTRKRLYTHIIVDEGQDFSPMMLKSLIEAVPEYGSFTFFGDVAQQIYGNALSWKASGINTKKIWKFENNYRNPIEIALFAQDIMKHSHWEVKGEEYVVPKFEIPAAGIQPTLVKYSNRETEITEITNLIKNRSGRNVVIVKNRELVRKFRSTLKANGINAVEIKKDTGSGLIDGTYVTTFYSVKGLEFDSVYIPFLNDEDFPDQDNLKSAESKEKVYANALKLFYIASTRAKQSLLMTYSSALTSLFPSDSENYISVEN